MTLYSRNYPFQSHVTIVSIQLLFFFQKRNFSARQLSFTVAKFAHTQYKWCMYVGKLKQSRDNIFSLAWWFPKLLNETAQRVDRAQGILKPVFKITIVFVIKLRELKNFHTTKWKFAVNKAFLKNLHCFRLWVRKLKTELRAVHLPLRTLVIEPHPVPVWTNLIKRKIHCPLIGKWWNVVCYQRIKTVLCLNLARKVRENKETQKFHVNRNFLLKSIPAETVQH